MALTIKQCNSDTSFLLSFEPIIPESAGNVTRPRPFTILLDPWVTGPSAAAFHCKKFTSAHGRPAYITSLSELPEPDLVIVSQHRSDHCNEATLRQLPASGTRTLILAEPAAARVIRSWRYFERDKVRTVERWEDPRLTGSRTALRVPVPAIVAGGQRGEVTVAFVPQKRRGPHGAIGITYRPPSMPNLHVTIPASLQQRGLATPPATPVSNAGNIPPPATADPVPDTVLYPPSPPTSPRSLRSVQSASTLLSPPAQPHASLPNSDPKTPSPPARPQRPTSYCHTRQKHHDDDHHHHGPPSPSTTTTLASSTTTSTSTSASAAAAIAAAAAARPLSVLFSPHGIAYAHLAAYATSHLVAEAALPLTALLHCMDSVLARPSWSWWWPGSGIGERLCAGAPAGAEIASRLGARVWVSAHDGDGDGETAAVRGGGGSGGGGMLRTRRWAREEVVRSVADAGNNSRDGGKRDGKRDPEKKNQRGGGGRGLSSAGDGGGGGGGGGRVAATEVMRLGEAGEVSVCADGVLWSSPSAGDEAWRGTAGSPATPGGRRGGGVEEEEEEEEEEETSKTRIGGFEPVAAATPANKLPAEDARKDGPAADVAGNNGTSKKKKKKKKKRGLRAKVSRLGLAM